MALTADEKKLLQAALCDGQFNGLAVEQDGRAVMGNITPAVLNYVAGLSDEDIRIQLRQYLANKIAQGTLQLTREQAVIATTQANLAALQDLEIVA